MPIIPVVKQDIWLPYLAGRKSDIGDARIIRCIPLKVMVIPVLGKEKKNFMKNILSFFQAYLFSMNELKMEDISALVMLLLCYKPCLTSKLQTAGHEKQDGKLF